MCLPRSVTDGVCEFRGVGSIRRRMVSVTGDLMTQRSVAESRLDRDAWLERSLEVLRDEGIFGVCVERLARDFGETKGSFYRHFDDRDDLFASLLGFWPQQYSEVVVHETSFANDDPARALLDVMVMVRDHDLGRYELAMRSWADHDERARNAVHEVYRKGRVLDARCSSVLDSMPPMRKSALVSRFVV